jgi:cytochrome c peroxidase
MKNTAPFTIIFASLVWVPPSQAQEPNHPDIPDVNPPSLDLQELRVMGLSVFSTPFNKLDGYGDGPFDLDEWNESPLALGHRPTLQGNGTFLRVNGLDAQSCNECHGVVSHATRPPTLGLGGVGGATMNAVIMPSVIDVADSSEKWVKKRGPKREPDLPLVPDGVADYNGRFSNAPFLFGGGGVELLGKEMTAQLQAALEDCDANNLSRRALETYPDFAQRYRTSFGTISCSNGSVDLSETTGIVPRKDASELTDVPVQTAGELLVVRPFGRKGENFYMRDFDRGAMQFHFGIEPEEVLEAAGLPPDADADRDGVTLEVTVAEMTALHAFSVTNPRPYMETLDEDAQQGFETFQEIGCADCHRPELITQSTSLPLAQPEEPTDPSANVYLSIDLTDAPVGFEQSENGGVVVRLFSDLKRHDMGTRLEETFERGDISNREFITARLWGVADTEPYLHDGRATTLYDAIEFHGGEAQAARNHFVALPPDRQDDLIHFLRHLRTPENPNDDIAAILATQRGLRKQLPGQRQRQRRDGYGQRPGHIGTTSDLRGLQ